MNEETSKLLQQLAAKLGTTTEYLWRVLLSQAPTSATIQLIQTAILFIVIFIFYRLHKKFIKPVKDGNYTSCMYDDMDCISPIMVITGIFLAILLLIDVCCIDNIINGYFNPEYWALDKIISQVK